MDQIKRCIICGDEFKIDRTGFMNELKKNKILCGRSSCKMMRKKQLALKKKYATVQSSRKISSKESK